MAELQPLVQEINRIINAPYQASLKDLHGLTCDYDLDALQLWAKSKPCQVDALALAVNDGLRQWPFMLELLERFGRVPAFRNSILRQNPLLIDTLCRKACRSAEAASRFSSPCIALISNPLPSDVSVPATLHELFLQEIKTMVTNPSVETIQMVYHMVTGLGPELLENFPSRTMEAFQLECTKLPGGINIQNSKENLLCLAMLGKIAICGRASLGVDPSSKRSSISEPKAEKWLRNTVQCFNLERGAKILQLVVARVILVLSAKNSFNEKDALDTLALAKEVLDAVELSALEDWTRKNGSMIGRLQEKVKEVQFRVELWTAAISFTISMYRSQNLPSTIAGVWDPHLVQSITTDCNEALSRLLRWCPPQSLMPFLDPHSIASVLNTSAMIVVRPAPRTSAEVEHASHLLAMLGGLDTSTTSSTIVRRAIQSFQSSESFAQIQSQIFLFNPERVQGNCWDGQVCRAVAVNLQTQLLTSICALFLRTATCGTDDANRSILPSLMSSIDLLKVLPNPPVSSSCALHKPTRLVTPMPILELECSPQDSFTSKDWREQLNQILAADASRSAEAVIRTVGTICRDLEERCKTVEQPLRAMTLDLQKSEDSLETARQRIKQLEDQVSKSRPMLDTLGSENDRLRERADSADTRAGELAEQLELSRGEIGRIRLEADSLASKELCHLGTIAAREHTISQQCSELTEKANEIKRAKETLEIATSETAAVVEDLENRLLSSDKALDELKESCLIEQQALSDLQEENAGLQLSAEKLTLQLSQANMKAEGLQADFDSRMESHMHELTNRGASHLAELRKVGDDAAKCISDKDEEIDRLKKSASLAAKESETNIQADRKTISALEARIGSMLKQRTTKAKEIAELNHRMMALLDANSTVETPSRPTQSHFIASEEFLDSPSLPDASVCNNLSKRVPVGGYDGAGDSSESSKSGPTPKRPKPGHQSLTKRSRSTVRFSIPPRSAHAAESSARKIPRRPLSDITRTNSGIALVTIDTSPSKLPDGPSRSVTKPNFGLGNLDDIDFSDSDVFKSTGSRYSAGSAFESGVPLDDTTDEL